ncbi:MAG: Fibronectin/fibrinogen-binding protein [uncultured Chloroflexi bacterium]|uniref:Fibronectin/fibrinogen-binding protein n=1 Tax=uncultured Chloroflexota bacterium TaxID=166587 RepID=A0A6J4HPV3_9CHLR|nr:MAG: Fibronectin/fibrinogen-binding protein [uncultured Chloroflexota bacterium]
MSFDALTTAAVCAELRRTLRDGRVQHVHHPEALALALEVYSHATGRGATHWLYCSAHPERARAHLAARRPPRTTDAVTPLLLLLRKYVDGGRLEDVAQPPLERVLRLRFTSRAPSGVLWRTELVMEIMGRLSNLILLDEDGSVMDSAKRVPAAINRVRTVLPKHRYDPPPPQDKLDPRTLAPFDLRQAVEDAGPRRSLADALVAQVNACSPLLAREVVHRAHGRRDVVPGETDWGAVAATFHGFWADAEGERFAPSVALEDGRVVAFAPYALRSFPFVEPVASISEAIERWIAAGAAETVAASVGGVVASPTRPQTPVDESRRRQLRAALLEAQDRLRARLYSLRRSLVDDSEVERLRRSGEYLLTLSGQLPAGASEVPRPSGEPIRLRPELSVVENAQEYFERYTKAKTALRDVPAMIETAEHEQRYVDEALTLLDLAATPGELTALRQEWAELGLLSGGQGGQHAASLLKKAPKSQRQGGKGRGRAPGGASGAIGAGFRRVSVDGFEVLVGRSGKGNDALLSREARPDDLWLHARGIPGAHVVVRSGGRDVPDAVLHRAAALAAGHSQARGAPSVGVDYTLRKYVDRVKGGPPGLANYRGERTLHVAPLALDAVETGD